jgi:hypothetical protein
MRIAFALLALLAASCSRPSVPSPQLVRLDDNGLRVLTSEFNEAAASTRIVVLLSPT